MESVKGEEEPTKMAFYIQFASQLGCSRVIRIQVGRDLESQPSPETLPCLLLRAQPQHGSLRGVVVKLLAV